MLVTGAFAKAVALYFATSVEELNILDEELVSEVLDLKRGFNLNDFDLCAGTNFIAAGIFVNDTCAVAEKKYEEYQTRIGMVS